MVSSSSSSPPPPPSVAGAGGIRVTFWTMVKRVGSVEFVSFFFVRGWWGGGRTYPAIDISNPRI